MTERGKRQLDVGAIVEIPLEPGYAYGVCIYNDPTYGCLWRIADAIMGARPADIASVVAGNARFYAFSPLEKVVGSGEFHYVGTLKLPVAVREIPRLRWPIFRPGTNAILRWKLWSPGLRSTDMPIAGPEDSGLSILEIVHPQALRQRLQSGWVPRTAQLAAAESPSDELRRKLPQVFLKFADDDRARRAVTRLRRKSWDAELRPDNDGVRVIGTKRSSAAADLSRDQLEALVYDLEGVLEGWGVALADEEQSPSSEEERARRH